MNGSVALITGAGNGMGRQVALRLGSLGWQIAAVDRDGDDLESLRQEMVTRGGTCQFATVDVSEFRSLDKEVQKLADRLGAIQLLVACAGIAEETPAVGMDVLGIEKILAINLLGVANAIATVLPGMLARREGHLAAVSSMASLRGLPEQMGYCASKAGVNALMESLRLDVKDHGIDVTTICPGWTRTEQTQGKYRDAELLSVEQATEEILYALQRRKRFHVFPRRVYWQLRLMAWLPQGLQDWLLLRRIRQLKTTKDPVTS